MEQTRSIVNFPSELFSTRKCLLQNTKKLENGFQFFIRKLTQQLALHLLEKFLFISALQTTLQNMEARDYLYKHTRKRLCSV